MRIGTFGERLSRSPEFGDYLLALGFTTMALLCRGAMEVIAPGIAYFVVALPAVVLSGVFCGTAPAILTALLSGGAIVFLFDGRALRAWPLLNSTQLDTLIFIPACAAIIWATSALRHFAAEAAVARSELQDALNARDLLIREADHRIKNSLQLVVSLLSLQLGKVSDKDAKAALTSAIARVNAVADAHLSLQQSADLKTVDLDQMLADLCGRVGSLNPSLTMRCHASVGLWLDAEQAIPLGLIASELLTNALRHAFPPGEQGLVTLTVSADSGTLHMTIADNGAGLPVTPLRQGLGTTVISSLARQIGAAITSQSAPGEGTTVIVSLKLPPVLEVRNRAVSNSAA